jgi:ATP-dependent helicase Lhr and Lhr-like helicase
MNGFLIAAGTDPCAVLPSHSMTLHKLPAKFEAWFASRSWAPRAHQLAMLDAAQNGDHTLLIAPTGAGKTLAGFLPSLVDIARCLRAAQYTRFMFRR